MKSQFLPSQIVSWIFGTAVFAIGILNLFLVHAVPGTVFLMLSLLYAPQTNVFLLNRFGFTVPPVAKVMLGIAVIWFTLGVSDLGDMID
ncbi:hypothetical protein [Pontibacter anaerobius]|uniref:Uncharacterized protein n=1 Tax=Pontibacter anaerobius TaxID=2993940 RepID=A0ABT3RI61_9BACT|nr:hypothetical protein [Pontibacter anaerobius]MCX2741052.1 hypothetical protein [Pontibacter anaerobius]